MIMSCVCRCCLKWQLRYAGRLALQCAELQSVTRLVNEQSIFLGFRHLSKVKGQCLLICTNNNKTELVLTTTVCYVSHVLNSLNVNLQKTMMIIVCLQYNLGDLLTDRFPLK